MLDFKERSRIRKIIYGKPMIIVIAILFVFIANGAWGMYQKSIEAREKRDNAEERLTKLRIREIELSKDILNLSTDRGVEGEIRDRFMVAKEGESVMIVTDPEAQKIHTVTVTGDNPSTMERMIGAIGISN